MERQQTHFATHASPKGGRQARFGLNLGVGLMLLIAVAACGRAPTDDVLRGGVPAVTNLHRTTGIPPKSVRTVNRNAAGWRVLYHPRTAPAGADQQAAAALCGLERKRPQRIIQLPLDAPYDDPGAIKIDIICG